MQTLAPRLPSLAAAVTSAPDWRPREQHLRRAYEALARKHDRPLPPGTGTHWCHDLRYRIKQRAGSVPVRFTPRRQPKARRSWPSA